MDYGREELKLGAGGRCYMKLTISAEDNNYRGQQQN